MCGWCSNEPLEKVPEKSPVAGVEIRVRLMVALLRLADQLYIDSSRINLDLLQEAPLPPQIKTRWWVYHYVQTLPIDKGRIRFHYSLPSVHRPLLGHIRALIEPDFEYKNNPTIRYLWDEHGLHLVPQKNPSVRFDPPSGFQREMSPDMVSYLRTAITPLKPIGEDEQKSVRERCSLVLDYENFLLQLGLEGYFPKPEEIGRLFVTLLKEANSAYSGPVDGLAIGHWDRPDLKSIADLLKLRTYNLLTVKDHEKTAEVLTQGLTRLLQGDDPPTRTLLIAPQEDLAPIIRQFGERGQNVSAWITELPEADIFRALVDVKLLNHVLSLSTGHKIKTQELKYSQTACILRLDTRMVTQNSVASIDEITAILEKIDQIKGKVDWWRLWLIQQGILVSVRLDEQFVLKLNSEHPDVVEARENRSTCIEIIQSLIQDKRGIQQSTLIDELAKRSRFLTEKEQALQFLELLRVEEIVYVGMGSASMDDQPLWYLNSTQWYVAAFNGNLYLPLFVLGIDHFLVRGGFLVIHEHVLPAKLARYIGKSIVEVVYQLALNEGWVRRQETNKKGRGNDGFLVGVKLVEDHEEVQTALLNRDTLLNVLYREASKGEVTRDELWSRLSNIRRFTLEQEEMNLWLSIFSQESLIILKADPHDTGHDRLQLNFQSPLVQCLLGRFNIYSLVLTLRILRATKPENGKSSDEVIERLSKYMRYIDQQLAAWTIAYVKSIKLVGQIKSNPSGDAHEGIYLMMNHRFIRELDQRSLVVCRVLTEMVGERGRRSRDGWVPITEVRQEMGRVTSFGYNRDEHNYWINQAIYRHKLLQQRIEREPGRPQQIYIRVLS